MSASATLRYGARRCVFIEVIMSAEARLEIGSTGHWMKPCAGAFPVSDDNRERRRFAPAAKQLGGEVFLGFKGAKV